MSKKNLIELCMGVKLAPNSKAYKMLKAGVTSTKELAKAMLTTKAYKNNADIAKAVNDILEPAAEEKPTVAEKKPAQMRAGEPRRS